MFAEQLERYLKSRQRFEEFADDPLEVDCSRVVRVAQIQELRWRSTGEPAVTRVWRAARSRKRPARR